MEISLGQQTGLLFFALLFGAFLGVFYDAGRIFGCLLGMPCKGAKKITLKGLRLPRSFKEGKEKKIGKRVQSILLFCGDLLFMLLSGAFFCVFLYAVNDGEFRFFVLLGVLLGFILYRFTVGRVLWLFASYIVGFIRLIFSWLLFGVLFPFQSLLRFLAFLSRKMRLHFLRICGMIVRKTESARGYRRLLKQDLKKMGISYGR